jgi:predicted lipoprotein with Yx(FWY)xxD motif
MTSKGWLWFLPLLAATLALGGCGGSSSGALVNVASNSKLKTKILVDARGMTLYLWQQEGLGKPACFDDPTYHCSRAWVPLRSTKTPSAGNGVDKSLLSTVQRNDGDPQVVYHGHPLYTDAGAPKFSLKGDRKPGDVNGQGFADWYVVSPSGSAVRTIP